MATISVESGLDRISDLPRNVVDHNLSFLPLKDAVMTGALSKNWTEKWHTMPNVIIDEKMFKDRMWLEGVANYILSAHKGGIKKFSFSNQVRDFCNVKSWIWLLSQQGIEEFFLLYQRGSSKSVPYGLYSCHQLKVLSLRRRNVYPPRSFTGFQSLVSLKLDKVDMAIASLERFISSCPLLEELTLRKLSRVDHLNIDVPKLKYLENSYIYKFCGLPSAIKELYMQCEFEKYLDACETFSEVIKYSHLKTLVINQCCFEKVDQVRFLLSMIGRAANLTLLDINACSGKSEAVMEPMAKFWEKQNSCPVILKKLQNVRMRSFHGKDEEMKLIQFVMGNSPVLEEITVEWAEKPEFDKHEVEGVLQHSCKASTQLKSIGGYHESSSSEDSRTDYGDSSWGS